jgi:hypothetical protein
MGFGDMIGKLLMATPCFSACEQVEPKLRSVSEMGFCVSISAIVDDLCSAFSSDLLTRHH